MVVPSSVGILFWWFYVFVHYYVVYKYTCNSISIVYLEDVALVSIFMCMLFLFLIQIYVYTWPTVFWCLF